MDKGFLIIILIGFIIAGCGKEQKDFQIADDIGTTKAYREFVEKHPQGKFYSRAQFLIDSLTIIRGGCTLELDSIPVSIQKEIEAISTLADKNQEMKMLSLLYDFVIIDSSYKDNARSIIQEILEVMSEKIFIRYIEEYEKKSINLLNLYINDDLLYPKYSYESILCRKILITLFASRLQYYDEKRSNFDAWGSFAETLKKRVLEERNMNAFERDLSMQLATGYYYIVMSQVANNLMQENSKNVLKINPWQLDICAKYQYWKLAMRLLSDGPYHGIILGIDKNPKLIRMLKEKSHTERHEKIKIIADSVITKVEIRQREEAKIILNKLFTNSNNINEQDKKGKTALIKEAIAGRIYTVSALIDSNANINIVDNDGWSALMWALLNDNEEVVTCLIDNDAQIDIISAALLNDSIKVDSLLKENVDINYQTKDQWTPLYAAVHKGHLKMIKYLIEKGAYVDKLTNHDTPLIYAVGLNNYDAVKILVESGANINIKNKDGETALSLAKSNDYENIVELIQDKVTKIGTRKKNHSIENKDDNSKSNKQETNISQESSYQVQIYASEDKNAAIQQMQIAVSKFDEMLYLVYEEPYFKVRIGNFLTMDNAKKFRKKAIEVGYGDAWIAKKIAKRQHETFLQEEKANLSIDVPFNEKLKIETNISFNEAKKILNESAVSHFKLDKYETSETNDSSLLISLTHSEGKCRILVGKDSLDKAILSIEENGNSMFVQNQLIPLLKTKLKTTGLEIPEAQDQKNKSWFKILGYIFKIIVILFFIGFIGYLVDVFLIRKERSKKSEFIQCPNCGKNWKPVSGEFPGHASSFRCPDCYFYIPIPR